MKNSSFKYLIFILSISFFSSCITAKAIKEITIENGQLPEEIASDSTVLLILLQFDDKMYERRYNRKIAKIFKKFKGEYELVDYGELKEKYKDVNKYRFVLNGNYEEKLYKESSMRVLRFHIEDRKIAGIYTPSIQSGNFYGKIAKAYVRNLNKIVENK